MVICLKKVTHAKVFYSSVKHIDIQLSDLCLHVFPDWTKKKKNLLSNFGRTFVAVSLDLLK
jgi:hypothetical protein